MKKFKYAGQSFFFVLLARTFILIQSLENILAKGSRKTFPAPLSDIPLSLLPSPGKDHHIYTILKQLASVLSVSYDYPPSLSLDLSWKRIVLKIAPANTLVPQRRPGYLLIAAAKE